MKECIFIIVPMYIDTVPNRNSPPAILLREDWREGNKTPKRTLPNLSDWPRRSPLFHFHSVDQHLDGC